MATFVRCLALAVSASLFSVTFAATSSERPKAGKVEFYKVDDIKPGMKATAWTVFSGTEPEAVPVEIIGVWKNAFGPKDDIILAKMGGKAEYTSVAAGMSGSPVYIDGKLVGAVAYRLGAFVKDAICGITPISSMLEINDFDATRPANPVVPGNPVRRASVEVPRDVLGTAVAGGGALLEPIESPIAISGVSGEAFEQLQPLFQAMGVKAVQGGGSATIQSSKPAPGWENALQPGDSISAVLVSGDMSAAASGTVTYNDGKRALGFGHPFLNLGPVDIPMAKGQVFTVLASPFQPMKLISATEMVGALRQDRHSGIMGELGATSPMVPVNVTIRTHGDGDKILKSKDLHFNVFVQQKWTPYLMMVTLFNSISGMNDYSEDSTYRLSGQVELDGNAKLSLSTMLAPSEAPMPPSMMLAGWWGDKFNRLFSNSVKTPKLKSVNAIVDLLPQRRIAAIENAFIPNPEVQPGTEVPVKVYLRPYRGDRIEREVKVRIPAGMPKGEHRILLSDADTLNRMQGFAANANRFIDLPETVSLINQERSNNRLYVSLVQGRPTYYDDDKTMPSLPSSVLNVMQSSRAANRPFVSSPESAQEQTSLPFDLVVNGSQSIKITVK